MKPKVYFILLYLLIPRKTFQFDLYLQVFQTNLSNSLPLPQLALMGPSQLYRGWKKVEIEPWTFKSKSEYASHRPITFQKKKSEEKSASQKKRLKKREDFWKGWKS